LTVEKGIKDSMDIQARTKYVENEAIYYFYERTRF